MSEETSLAIKLTFVLMHMFKDNNFDLFYYFVQSVARSQTFIKLVKNSIQCHIKQYLNSAIH